MEENMTIEEKARQLVGCDSLYCKSSDANFCRACITKPGKKSCREVGNMLEVADFVIDKAVNWLRENATDYLDKAAKELGSVILGYLCTHFNL